jgi:hypothetical protein
MLPVSLGAVSGYQYSDVLMKVDSMAAFTRDFGATILNGVDASSCVLAYKIFALNPIRCRSAPFDCYGHRNRHTKAAKV